MSSRLFTVTVFVLLSLVLWYLLDGMVLREYVAVLPLFFSLQILLNDFIEVYLLTRFGAGWFRFIVAPGTILHELSHAVAAKLVGCNIKSASLFSLKSSGTLGSVVYEQPSDQFAVIRSFFVGFAPFFGCGIVFVALMNLARSYYSVSPLSPHVIDLGSISLLLDSIYEIIFLFYQQFSYIDVNPLMPLLLYFQICVGLGAAASSVDLKEAFSSMVKHPLGTLLLLLFFVLVFFLSENPISSAYVVLVFRWIVFILLSSISLLIASIPLIFFGVIFVEVSLLSKIVVVLASIITYLLSASVVLSLAVFAVFLLILRFSWLFIKPQ